MEYKEEAKKPGDKGENADIDNHNVNNKLFWSQSLVPEAKGVDI